MPTREFVGLLADVHPFASTDDEDPFWYRVVIEWDGARLHASAGDSVRCAHVSWGPDDEDDSTADTLFEADRDVDPDPWRLALSPADIKEMFTKFKLTPKQGAAPLSVSGNIGRLRVQRNGEHRIALTSVAECLPWSDDHPNVQATIREVRNNAGGPENSRATVAYTGAWLSDFANPKVVRQRGLVSLYFGPTSTYVRIGSHFEGAIIQDQAVPDGLR